MGVDDFLVNHPTMGLSYVVDTLRGAVCRYRDNPGIAVDEKVVESFTLVPGMLELYRNCQVVHAELDVPAD